MKNEFETTIGWEGADLEICIRYSAEWSGAEPDVGLLSGSWETGFLSFDLLSIITYGEDGKSFEFSTPSILWLIKSLLEEHQGFIELIRERIDEYVRDNEEPPTRGGDPEGDDDER